MREMARKRRAGRDAEGFERVVPLVREADAAAFVVVGPRCYGPTAGDDGRGQGPLGSMAAHEAATVGEEDQGEEMRELVERGGGQRLDESHDAGERWLRQGRRGRGGDQVGERERERERHERVEEERGPGEAAQDGPSDLHESAVVPSA